MVRILCLHGFAQHPAEIATKTMQIQRALPDCNFIFPPAAIKLTAFDGDINDRSRPSEDSADRYSWNYPEDNMSTNLLDLEASMQRIIPVLETEGPFDGIMGFSQGAAVASAVASILSRDSSIRHPVMKFAILFCGARPASSIFDGIYHGISTPSLHLVGKQDVMVPLERSLELARAFELPIVVCHPGNHFIPQGWTYTQCVSKFVKEVMTKHNLSSCDLQCSSIATQEDNQGTTTYTDSSQQQTTRRNTSKLRLVRKRSLVKLSTVCCR